MEVPDVFGKRRFVLPVIFLTLIIGGVLIFTSPAFHSYHPNPNYTQGDPYTTIWRPTNTSNVYQKDIYQGKTGYLQPNLCTISTASCQFLQSNSTTTVVILTNSTLPDLSIANGKNLNIHVRYDFCCGAITNPQPEFGWYLTTNSTLPTHDIGSATAYNPVDDASVIYLQRVIPNQSGHSGGSAFFIQNQATPQKPISNQAAGCPGGSTFICTPTINVGYVQNHRYIMEATLNFTGSGTVAGVPNCSASGTGSGCSFLNSGDFDSGNTTITSSNIFPNRVPVSANYYFGVYMKPQASPARLDIPFDTSGGGPCNNESPCISAWIPPMNSIAPTIDTGGFFGPIVRALIGIGVFFATAVIGFLVYLDQVVTPVLSLVIAVWGLVFTSVFNAIGSIWGDGSLGNQILNFMSGVTSFLINILVNAITYFTNSVISAAVDLVNITQTVFGEGNAFIGPILGFFQGLGTLIPSISAFLQQLLAFYSVGVFGVSTIMIVWTSFATLAALLDWIDTDSPIAAFIAIFLTGFLLYMLTLGNSVINPVASNIQVLGSYQTAYTNTVFFFDMMPVFFFSMLISWASTLTGDSGLSTITGGISSTRRSLHSSEKSPFGLTHFTSFITTSEMITVRLFKAGYWFFKESFDIVAKAIAAIKGRWSPVEVLGTG